MNIEIHVGISQIISIVCVLSMQPTFQTRIGKCEGEGFITVGNNPKENGGKKTRTINKTKNRWVYTT